MEKLVLHGIPLFSRFAFFRNCVLIICEKNLRYVQHKIYLSFRFLKCRRQISLSGREDSNLRLLAPKTSALARLSYAPMILYFNFLFQAVSDFFLRLWRHRRHALQAELRPDDSLFQFSFSSRFGFLSPTLAP